MGAPFHSFVVFAEMRTGSNFLESNLNALDGVRCVGEAFNPHFIGYPKQEALLGVSQDTRDRNPSALLDRMEAADILTGFRYFHDHDPRILDRVLDDLRIAKIILTRDPLHSYISWKIARTTGQWKLTDVRRRKETRAHFDPTEFTEHCATIAAFRQQVLARLQNSGQTAFHITYDDLQSVGVINGLAQYLGSSARLAKLESKLKVQNPEPISDKVTNPEVMDAALGSLLRGDLGQAPDFEPKRFAVVPTYVLGAETPLIYMPIRSGPHDQVKSWMAALDGVGLDALPTQLSQKELRQWRRGHKGHRSFTVLRHPVARAHHAYCAHILGLGPQDYKAIRRTLVKRYGLPLPVAGPDDSYDREAHRNGFTAFLTFLKANLNGQTAIRVDPSWCTQAQALQGFATVTAPDFVLREEELPALLPALAQRLGSEPQPFVHEPAERAPFQLAEIYDETIETLAATAYQKDYLLFGFDRLL